MVDESVNRGAINVSVYAMSPLQDILIYQTIGTCKYLVNILLIPSKGNISGTFTKPKLRYIFPSLEKSQPSNFTQMDNSKHNLTFPSCLIRLINFM